MKRFRIWYDSLAARERRLLVTFVIVLVAFALFLVPFAASASLGSKRAEVKTLREAIFSVQNSREKFAERKAKREAIAARYRNKAPALAGFIENAARQSGLEIPESQDHADVPLGKHYTERSTAVRLRKVSMLPLVRMLEKIENTDYPIVISRLNIRKRGGEADSYDVELGVSAYDSTAASKGPDMPKPSTSGGNP